MLEFIKMFGLGVLYTLAFPIIVVIFAVCLVYVFVNYLVLECINLVGFFFGYTFTVETELEQKLADMKEKNGENADTQDVAFDDFFLKEDVVNDLRGSENDE